jgi:hypothetical protein
MSDQANQFQGSSLIRPNRISSLSMIESFFIFSTSMAGIAVIRSVRHWNCGLILVTIIHITVALLSYYSVWMLLYVMKTYKVCNYQSCWRAVGFKGSWIIAIMMSATIAIFLAACFLVIWRMWIGLLFHRFPGLPAWITDPYLLHFVVIAVVFLPIVFRRDRHFLAYFSIVKAGVLVVFYGLNIYWCWVQNRDWTAEKPVNMVDTSQPYFPVLTDYVAVYISFFCIWAPLMDMRDFTFERGTKVIRWGYITFFVFSHSITIIQYFTFYGTMDADVILECLQVKNATIELGYVLVMMHMFISITSDLDPLRMVLLSFVQEMDKYPIYIWAAFGYIPLIFGVLLGQISEQHVWTVSLISNTFPIFLQFIGPAIMMAKVMKTGVSRVHWAGIVLLALVGALGLVAALAQIVGVM